MKKIKAVIVLPESLDPQEKQVFIKKGDKAGINLNFYPSLKEAWKEAGASVFLVHESLLEKNVPHSFEPRFFEAKLIVLKDQDSELATIYKKAARLSAETIISIPLKSRVVFESIRTAHQALLAEKEKEAKTATPGKALAVTSFKSGVGKSLISYNLAFKLSKYLKDSQICLIDLNRPFGVSKAFVDLESDFSWDTIRPLLSEVKNLSQRRLFGVLNPTSYGFSLLSGPSDFRNNRPLKRNELKNLSYILKKYFKLAIFDLPAILSQEDLKTLAFMDRVLLVLSTESASIVNAKNAFSFLKKEEPNLFEKLLFVVNRADNQRGKGANLLSTRLGIDPLGSIEDDTEAVENFLSQGKLFEDESLLITQDFNNLAEEVFKKLF